MFNGVLMSPYGLKQLDFYLGGLANEVGCLSVHLDQNCLNVSHAMCILSPSSGNTYANVVTDVFL